MLGIFGLAFVVIVVCAYLLPGFVQKRTVAVMKDLQTLNEGQPEQKPVTLAELGQFGDMHGFVNSFFSGATLVLVICGVVVQLYQLSHEKRRADVELRTSGLLTALPVLIADLRSQVHGIAPVAFPDSNRLAFGAQELRRLLVIIDSGNLPSVVKNPPKENADKYNIELEGVYWRFNDLKDLYNNKEDLRPVLQELLKLQTELSAIYHGLKAGLGVPQGYP